MIQKRRRCLLSAYPGAKGLRIAHTTQDRQRLLAHASTNYIRLRYIETHHVDVSVVICLLWFGICEVLGSQRQTFENVFPIYKIARSPINGLTSDDAKVKRKIGMAKKNEEKNK